MATNRPTSVCAYLIPQKFARNQGNLSQFGLPIYVKYDMRQSLLVDVHYPHCLHCHCRSYPLSHLFLQAGYFRFLDHVSNDRLVCLLAQISSNSCRWCCKCSSAFLPFSDLLLECLHPVRESLPSLIRRVLLGIMESSHGNLALRGPGAAELLMTRQHRAWLALNV
jgi:hypothetical protein